MEETRTATDRTWSVPPWAALVEAAVIAAVWFALQRVFASTIASRNDARIAAIVLTALPPIVWLIATRFRIAAPHGQSIFLKLTSSLMPAAIATGLAPALQFVFLTPRPAPSPPAMLVLAIAALVIALPIHALAARQQVAAPQRANPKTIYILIAAEFVALAGTLLFAERPMTRFRWPDILTYGFRDAVRILVVALIAAYLVQGRRAIRAATSLASRRIVRMPPARFIAIAAIISVVCCGLFSGIVLERMPHIQDEIAIHFQAKVFAMGRLYADPPALPEFFDQEFLVCDTPQNKWYGKYQPGASALMAIGVPLGLEWLVHPILAGVGMALMFGLARRLLPDGLARAVVLLAVVSPFWILTYASMMLHPGCLTVLLGGAYALVRACDSRRPAGWALAAGLLLAGTLLFRPYTALVLGTLIGALVLVARWRAFLRPTLFAPLLIGAVVSGGLTLAYNRTLTGDMMVTPFSKYSPNDRLGFGENIGLDYWMPADRVHDPARAERNFRINFDSLTKNLLGWPTAALLIVPLALAWRRRGLVAALLLVIASLPIAYTFYLFHGEVFGPRYWSETMPAWFMLTAVGLVSARRWLRAGLARFRVRAPAARSRAMVIVTAGLMTLSAMTAYWPGQLEFYGFSLWQTDRQLHDAVRAAGVHNAVVFVKAAPYHRTMVFSDLLGNGFAFNTPTLDGDIVYARDLEEENVRLMPLYPGRRFYTVRPGLLAASTLEEITPPATTTRPGDASTGDGDDAARALE